MSVWLSVRDTLSPVKLLDRFWSNSAQNLFTKIVHQAKFRDSHTLLSFVSEFPSAPTACDRLGSEDRNVIPFIVCEVRENRSTASHTLFRGVNEYRNCHVYCPIWVKILYAHNSVRHWRVLLKKTHKGLFVSCGRKFIYIHSWRCNEQPAAVGVLCHGAHRWQCRTASRGSPLTVSYCVTGLTADSVVLRHGAHRWQCRAPSLRDGADLNKGVRNT